MDLAKQLRDVRMPNGAIIGLNWAGAAELERQREVIADLEAQLTQAAEAERAAVVADMRQTAQNMRRYPYESATMAEAMVIAARAIQDLADRYERRAHLEAPHD